ncbi:MULTISPECIES: pilin [Undibacterium]|jgi:type IV pilus assembly protein PilA|uniref:Pilin n=1 Tax=Undibacterium umbellatum TaxID=2762300 RepID=A0ABR6Z536_9BURK|nr:MULTISPECIES: pilin [Undibacterium]MBC3906734.1 pilin [Undibacterium umbellatum]MDP1979707.1 pilin [Undibacterium sp.]
MKKHSGFTLLEMMAVVVIIAILSSIAIPTFLLKIIREQLETGIRFADIAQKPVAAAWLAEQKFPADNLAAGLPVADKIVSNLVSSVSVQNGVVNITFGNSANGALKGKVISLRPAVVEDAPMVPVAWICSNGPVPNKMTVKGIDSTTVAAANLPSYCRSKTDGKK